LEEKIEKRWKELRKIGECRPCFPETFLRAKLSNLSSSNWLAGNCFCKLVQVLSALGVFPKIFELKLDCRKKVKNGQFPNFDEVWTMKILQKQMVQGLYAHPVGWLVGFFVTLNQIEIEIKSNKQVLIFLVDINQA
jgi:hypothetical protein